MGALIATAIWGRRHGPRGRVAAPLLFALLLMGCRGSELFGVGNERPRVTSCSEAIAAGQKGSVVEPGIDVGLEAYQRQLLAQLNGGRCRYCPRAGADGCRRVQAGELGCRRHDDWLCLGHGATCLGYLGEAARPVVPDLLVYLEAGLPNMDTGDGIIGIRSRVVEALGAIGDPRAVAPLIAILERDRAVIGPAVQAQYPRLTQAPPADVAALQSLGRLNDPAATGPILRWLRRKGARRSDFALSEVFHALESIEKSERTATEKIIDALRTMPEGQRCRLLRQLRGEGVAELVKLRRTLERSLVCD